MGEHVAVLHTATNALQALGRGFDVNFDTRLLYCKGVSGSRVVEIDEEHHRDLCLYDDVFVSNVSTLLNHLEEELKLRGSHGGGEANDGSSGHGVTEEHGGGSTGDVNGFAWGRREGEGGRRRDGKIITILTLLKR